MMVVSLPRSVRLHRTRGERGSSLFEVIAALMLLSIVLGVVYQAIWSTGDVIIGTENRLRNLAEARLVMDVTTKDVRTATRLGAGTSPFVYADANEIEFYANLNPTLGPRKVKLWVDTDGTFYEEIWEPDEGSSAPDYTYTNGSKYRTVAEFITNDESNPIFTYLDSDGNELSDLPLSEQDRLAVKAVEVSYSVNVSAMNPTKATTLVSRVRLPNIDYNAVAE